MTVNLRKEFDIFTMELDFDGFVSLPRLCKCAMDLADSHAIELGWGMESLFERKQGWVLVQFHMKVDEYPFGRGKIDVKTWPSGSESRFAFREFQFFKDGSSIPFAVASSNWVLMDLEKGRPIRVFDHIHNSWEIDKTRTLENNFDVIKTNGNYSFAKLFPVRLSDIDILKHVNNIRYIDCILESVPGDIWKNYEISELWVEFRKQAVFGDTIETKIIESQNDSGNDEIEFIHILDKEGAENITFARAKTIRKKRLFRL